MPGTYDLFKAPVGSTYSYTTVDGLVTWTKREIQGSGDMREMRWTREGYGTHTSDAVYRFAMADSLPDSRATITLPGAADTFTATGERHTARLMTKHEDGTPWEIGRFVSYALAQRIAAKESDRWVELL